MGSSTIPSTFATVEPVRVSLFGAGAWARTAHLVALQARSDVILESVFDVDLERAHAAAEEFGFALVATTVTELLNAPADACIVASPAALHFEQAAAALESGRHVLLEKPMTNSAESAWSIAELAQRNRRHVMLALGWNYSEVFAAAEKIVAAESLGAIEHVALHMASATHDLLSGISNDSSGRVDRPALSSTWTNPALAGGGYGNAQLSHALGVLFGLVNESAVDLSAVVRPGPIDGIELSVAIAGRLESGATVSISGTSIRRSRIPRRQQLDLRVYGSQGQLDIDFVHDRVAFINADGVESTMSLSKDSGAYRGTAPANAFIDLITGASRTNTSSAAVGARSTEVLDYVRARMPH